MAQSTENQQQIVDPPSCSGRVGLDILERKNVDSDKFISVDSDARQLFVMIFADTTSYSRLTCMSTCHPFPHMEKLRTILFRTNPDALSQFVLP